MVEEWKQIPNSTYAISNFGKVKRLSYNKLHNINKTYYITKEQILKPSNNNSKKYWRIQIFYINGIKKYESVHRLVANAFVPNTEDKPQINHKDGDKNNNHFTNLEWVTNLENNIHKHTKLKIFNSRYGSKCNLSKLTELQIYEIAQKIKNGEKPTNIAKEFNVCSTTIYELKAGRSWSHLGLFRYKKKKSSKYDMEKLGLRYSPTTIEK